MVNNNEMSQHITEECNELGFVINEESFNYLGNQTEGDKVDFKDDDEEDVEDDDEVATLQVQHKEKPNMRAPQISVVACSPVKKKVKKVAGVSVSANILKSPAKNSPRKRKVSKSALLWDNATVAIFLSECENFQQSVQCNVIPLATWKAISIALETKHNVQVGWDICRDKFMQMKDFFMDTLLPLERVLAGKKWPHYDQFCRLYEIPTEYYSMCIDGNGDDEDDDADPDPEKGSSLWPSANVELLLDLYKVKKDAFESIKSFLKHALLFSKIANDINDFTGQNYSSKQRHSKMSSLNDKFRKEYDSCNKTGQAPSKWPRYEKMLDMFKGSPTLIAPYTVSAGRGLFYCAKGQEQASGSSEVGSRSRPKNENKPKENKPKGKKSEKGYRTWQHELQARKLANQEALNEEVRLLRLNLEAGRLDRQKYMERLLKRTKSPLCHMTGDVFFAPDLTSMLGMLGY